jgi:hypothetical protein
MTGITKFNGRSIIMILLVVLMLALSATPALAWLEEGDDTKGRASLPCRVIPDGKGGNTVYCFDGMPDDTHIAVRAPEPLAHPAIVRAETPFLAVPGTDSYLVQTGQ